MEGTASSVPLPTPRGRCRGIHYAFLVTCHRSLVRSSDFRCQFSKGPLEMAAQMSAPENSQFQKKSCPIPQRMSNPGWQTTRK